MGVQGLQGADLADRSILAILQDLFRAYHPRAYHPRAFADRHWEGTTWDPESGQRGSFTPVLRHPGSVRTMLLPVTRPRLVDRLRLARSISSLPNSHGPRDGRHATRRSGRQHSIDRDQAAVTCHYSVSSDLYTTFLDQWMVYSCANLASDFEDLDSAQVRTLDYICRKLRLQIGQRLVHVICGGGGLVMHTAQHYGVEVFGITLSPPQTENANARIHEAGLAGHCRVEVLAYRLGFIFCYWPELAVALAAQNGYRPPFLGPAKRSPRQGGTESQLALACQRVG